MYHWTVTDWLSEQEPHGHEFRISVDAEFLSQAKICALECDQEAAQKYARILARKAGYRVDDSANLLTFGFLGIQQINHPYGGGCWLSLDSSSLGSDFAQFYAKNVDRADQQAFLMAVWVWWAEYVSARI